VFTVSQIYLSDAISGRDKALQELRFQISELSKIIQSEINEKEELLETLSEKELLLRGVQNNLQQQELITEGLQEDLAKKNTAIFVQEQNILALSNQITELLSELRIVAKALEIYEGFDSAILGIEGLGERINKALATRIDQLKVLNTRLDDTNKKLAISEASLNEKINELSLKNQNLMAINESLGLEDGGIIEQLDAIKNKNQELALLNQELTLRDEELQNQINQYQSLMNDLLKINDSLGLKDVTLKEQLEAIKNKNLELAKLNQNLINKDNTIFDLRGKIIELNNVLSISDEKRIKQELEISLLQKNIQNIQDVRIQENKISTNQIEEMEVQASQTFEQISILSDEIENLKNEIVILNKALEANEQETISKNIEIEILGERLNKALTSKIFELQKYRSEFFGKLQNLLGDRDDIKVVGDRFIFESELLFDSSSANLQKKGKEKLKEIAMTLMETTRQIPTDIDWIIQVEGHTDKRPINTSQFPSNWELSTARANSVLKLLLEIGFLPTRLAAAGYGEFYPISYGNTKEDYQQNRRIELKLTSR
jgi:chemotaxis protein MotB